MIKTEKEVSVPTGNRRDIEQKIVFAKIEKVEIIADIYNIHIKEFVKEEYDLTGENGEAIKGVTEREICKVVRKKTADELQGLIDILQNDEFLKANGLSDFIGTYADANQLKQNKIVPEIGHLIINNTDLIRGSKWVIANE